MNAAAVRAIRTRQVAKGDPLQTALSQPHGVFVDKDGTLYICDSMNGRVFKVVK